jgi:hypothetical protein
MADVEVTTPVETPVAAPEVVQEATPTPETTAAPEIPETPEAKPERTFTQKELDEIVQKRLSKESRRAEKLAEERVRRELAERELERIRTERNPQPQGKPKEEDYAGRPYSEYVEALAEWKADQKFQAKAQESAAQRQQREAGERIGRVLESVSRGSEDIPDFKEAVFEDETAPITEAMVIFAEQAAQKPAKLLHYIATHREEGERIAKLPPAKQMLELHALESKLSAPPKPTDTPPPIKPNTTKASAETGYRPDMTDAEYAAMRRRQIAQRR